MWGRVGNGKHPRNAQRSDAAFYAEAIKLQETVIASHQEIKDSVARLETWEKAVKSSISQIKDLNWWLQNLTRGGLIMIFCALHHRRVGGRRSRAWRSGSLASRTD